jgi:hypothetical protein
MHTNQTKEVGHANRVMDRLHNCGDYKVIPANTRRKHDNAGWCSPIIKAGLSLRRRDCDSIKNKVNYT